MIIQRIPVLQLANKPPKPNQHCYQICHDHIRGVMEAVFWRLAFSCSLTFVSPPPPFPRTYWKSVSSNLFWCCRFWKIEYHIIYNHLEGPIKCDKKKLQFLALLALAFQNFDMTDPITDIMTDPITDTMTDFVIDTMTEQTKHPITDQNYKFLISYWPLLHDEMGN